MERGKLNRLAMKSIIKTLKYCYNKSLWIGLLVLPFFFYFAFQHFQMNCKEMVREVENEMISGKIKDKYIDKENHALITIIYFDAKANTEKKLIYGNDRSGVMEFLKIGDSISKQTGSYKFQIFRKGEVYNFSLDFNCGL